MLTLLAFTWPSKHPLQFSHNARTLAVSVISRARLLAVLLVRSPMNASGAHACRPCCPTAIARCADLWSTPTSVTHAACSATSPPWSWSRAPPWGWLASWLLTRPSRLAWQTSWQVCSLGACSAPTRGQAPCPSLRLLPSTLPFCCILCHVFAHGLRQFTGPKVPCCSCAATILPQATCNQSLWLQRVHCLPERF